MKILEAMEVLKMLNVTTNCLEFNTTRWKRMHDLSTEIVDEERIRELVRSNGGFCSTTHHDALRKCCDTSS